MQSCKSLEKALASGVTIERSIAGLLYCVLILEDPLLEILLIRIIIILYMYVHV